MKDKKLMATMGLSNTCGIAIIDYIYGIEDKVKFAYFTCDDVGRTSTSIIKTDNDGRHYFISGKRKYYLNEFIRVN